MKLPKVIIMDKIDPGLPLSIAVLFCNESCPAAYCRATNTIELTKNNRWLIIHELLHWWAFELGGWDHWLNYWLDTPCSSRRRWIRNVLNI